jgi:hypothetical protein
MKPCMTQGKAFHRLALPCCRRGRSPACTFRGFSSDAHNVACCIASRAEEDARSGTERVVWVTSTPGCLGTNWEQTFSSLISLWSHISVVRFEFGIATSSASAPMSPICDTNKQRATCIQRTTKHATAMQLTTQPQHCNRADVADLGRRRARLLRNTCARPRTRAAVGLRFGTSDGWIAGRVLGNGGVPCYARCRARSGSFRP